MAGSVISQYAVYIRCVQTTYNEQKTHAFCSPKCRSILAVRDAVSSQHCATVKENVKCLRLQLWWVSAREWEDSQYEIKQCKYCHEVQRPSRVVWCICRLPIIQGAAASFLVPARSLFALDEWKCSASTLTGTPTHTYMYTTRTRHNWVLWS